MDLTAPGKRNPWFCQYRKFAQPTAIYEFLLLVWIIFDMDLFLILCTAQVLYNNNADWHVNSY